MSGVFVLTISTMYYMEDMFNILYTILYMARILIKLIWVFATRPAVIPDPDSVLPPLWFYPNDADTDEVDDNEYSIYDDIEEAEEREPEKQTGKYYLGGFFRMRNQLLLNATVSARTFFRYDYPVICRYIWNCSTFEVGQSPGFDIMKLYITETGVYQVVLKTTWIRIVQRAWKRRFAERKRAILMRGSVREQEYFRMNGRYRTPMALPSLRGLF